MDDQLKEQLNEMNSDWTQPQLRSPLLAKRLREHFTDEQILLFANTINDICSSCGGAVCGCYCCNGTDENFEAERAARPHKRERAMRMVQTVDVTLAGGRALLLARSDGKPDVFANASAALHRCDELKRSGLPCHVLFDGAYYIQVEREQWGAVS